MLLETSALAVALIAALAPWRALPAPSRLAPAFVQAVWAPVFKPSERAVDNWRREGALNLDLDAEQAVALALGREIRGVTRCVRLNNYWCVKKAGWTGEIASDAEGHVAFATAADGAAVAANLLRRYYVDFKLHSARAIVQRWAPAQCGLVMVSAPRRIAGRSVGKSLGMGGRTLLGPEPRGLTTRGLGSTLRARWLAGHGRAGIARRGAKGSKIAVRRSVVADRVGPMMKTPTIAAGIGAVETASTKSTAPVRLAMLPFPGLAMGPTPGFQTLLPPLPTMSCASETQRIANYAGHIAEGIVAGPDADLALFDADGKPTPNLSRALFNMAGVEIGPLRARQTLVDAAIAAALARRP